MAQDVHVLDTDQSQKTSSTLERLGIPPALAWGFLGVLIFMIGDGVESGYLSPFLIGRGFSEQGVALMFTLYGICVAIAAWGSGALSDLWGPRRVMWCGLAIWAVFEVLFLTFGIATLNYPIMVASYAIRGFGYPLFAYGFLVWIAAATSPRRLGSAVGWFWFAFTGGLPTLGSFIASFLIPSIGQYLTFWCSLALVVLGGLIALIGVRERIGSHPLAAPGTRPMETLLSSVSIAFKQPKLAIGCIVRVINTSAEFGFLIFLPLFFTTTIGFSLSEWLRLLSYIFLSNIIWNLLFGVIGDKIGWRRTVAFCGGFGCAISTLLLYYVPSATHDYPLSVLMGIFYGATLAGYVPLSALMPSLAPENKGAAMSMLNLGAGASAWVGPAIVGIFIGSLGVIGVMWIFAILYVISGILALFLTLPADVEAAATQEHERHHGFGELAYGAGGSILAHFPTMPDTGGKENIDLILFDVGGAIYDDNCFAQALFRAIRDFNPDANEDEFWSIYDTQRGQSSGSLRATLTRHFAPAADREELNTLTRQYWEYPPSALYPDVKPTLTVLASRYRLGLVANSQANVIEALRRDGIADLFSVMALSDIVGVEKPHPRIFQYALDKMQVPAYRAVHVGNRLDTDVRPATQLGLRTVWILRGEAPPAPTHEQLNQPDEVITSLIGLPTAIARLVTPAAQMV
ncbi:MAG TPA: RbtT/DalT/CsbX family MFS transporter [Dictyobacter sp.]|jgi:polyol permease family|nr:RbtT/DalT/CsbX family MFS transporter [Dictyobacter sp.]